MTSGLVKQLTDILNQENDIYDTISKLSNNKTQIIVEGKVAELENVVKIEQSLVMKIAKLEEQRENIVDKLCAQLGRKANEVTISDLLVLVGEKESRELKDSQLKIRETLNGLKQKNELNSKLLKNSLEYIDFSINVATSVGTLNNDYNSSGNTGDSKKRTIFDVKL